jgi:hypothetical protein
MNRIVCVALVVSSLAWTQRASAGAWHDKDQQALPCRPTIACTADIVPPGAAEVEVGYLFRQLQGTTHQHAVPILLKLTLAAWVQLQFGSNGPTFANGPVATRYLDDLVTGLKLHVLDQSRRIPSLSWSVELSSPISTAAGFIRSYDLFYTLYATKDIGRLHADLNAGVNLWQLEGATKPQAWVALAVSTELPRRFTIMAENYYFSAAAPFAPQDGGLLVALAYAPRKWLVLDVGGDVGYFQSMRSYSVFSGMTITPVRFWRPRR